MTVISENIKDYLFKVNNKKDILINNKCLLKQNVNKKFISIMVLRGKVSKLTSCSRSFFISVEHFRGCFGGLHTVIFRIKMIL